MKDAIECIDGKADEMEERTNDVEDSNIKIIQLQKDSKQIFFK